MAAIHSLPVTCGRLLGLAGTEPVFTFYSLYPAKLFVANIGASSATGVRYALLTVTKWFAWRQTLAVVLIMGLAVWGFRNVLGRQSAFPTEALDG
jgi:hypothetical protein